MFHTERRSRSTLIIIITSDPKLVLQWLSYQAHGVIGSMLGLVDPVSIHSDWF